MLLSTAQNNTASLGLIEGCLTAILATMAFIVPRLGSAWFARIERPFARLARRKGLMVAAELDSAELGKLTVAEMLKRHILINCTSDTVLRFLPPFILERAHVDTAIKALDEIFSEYAAGQGATASAGGHQRG